MKKIYLTLSWLILILFKVYTQSIWVEQIHPFNTQGALTDVFFINSLTGWFCGQGGMLGKTTNGGINWINTSFNNSINYKCLYFINENTGWLGGGTYRGISYFGTILKTTNGGYNWSIDTLSEDNNIPSKIYFINSTMGWFSATGLYKTTNGGFNWIRNFVSSFENYGFKSISFPSLNIGYCSGNFFNPYTGLEKYIIAKSINGGLNWQVVRIDSALQSPYHFYYDLQFLDINIGYLCGDTPLKTVNGGINWFEIMDVGPFSSMFFINANTGWFGKWNYATFTTNGGNSWSEQPLPISALFHGLFFINENTGWGVGLTSGVTYPKVFKTTNGGNIGIVTLSNEIAEEFYLYQNYPNPFNPITKIKFSLPITSVHDVKLVVYDLLGREVASLIPPLWGGKEGLSPGTYEVDFDGSNLPSGVYYYQLIAGDYSETRKMVLIK